MWHSFHLDDRRHAHDGAPHTYDEVGSPDYTYRNAERSSSSMESSPKRSYTAYYPDTDRLSVRRDDPPEQIGSSLLRRDAPRTQDSPRRIDQPSSNASSHVTPKVSIDPQVTDLNRSMQPSHRAGSGNRRVCTIDITVQIGGNRREPHVSVSSDHNQSVTSMRSTRRVDNCAMIDISMDPKDGTAQIYTDGIIRD